MPSRLYLWIATSGQVLCAQFILYMYKKNPTNPPGGVFIKGFVNNGPREAPGTSADT